MACKSTFQVSETRSAFTPAPLPDAAPDAEKAGLIRPAARNSPLPRPIHIGIGPRSDSRAGSPNGAGVTNRNVSVLFGFELTVILDSSKARDPFQSP